MSIKGTTFSVTFVGELSEAQAAAPPVKLLLEAHVVQDSDLLHGPPGYAAGPPRGGTACVPDVLSGLA
jgi:hypothetical protein